MTVLSIDPRTGHPRGPGLEESGAAAVAASVDRAGALFPTWSGRSRHERGRVLAAMAAALEHARTDLVAVADAETALGVTRLDGEISRTSHQLRFFAEVVADGGYLDAAVDHADPQATPPRPDLRRWRIPIGPVAVFGASNFPFAFSVLGGDTASALAAGCPVVVKAHHSHPETSLRTLEAVQPVLRDHGLDHLVQLVAGHAAGSELVRHPGIAAVGFTGSFQGGRALADLAASRANPIPFYGELGSLNPVIVTAPAALERAEPIGQGLAASATLGGGQFCTQPGLWFVPTGAAGDALVRAACAAMDSTPPQNLLNDSILEAYAVGVRERAAHPGVKVLVSPGTTPARAVGPGLIEVPVEGLGGPLVEECFGPVSVIARYAEDREAGRVLSTLPGALTVTLHHGEHEDVSRWIPLMTASAGRMVFNGFPTGVAVAWAMTHGGPWPATTAPTTSVGAGAIARFLRPVTYQDAPDHALPIELREGPLLIPTRIDGRLHLPSGDPQ